MTFYGSNNSPSEEDSSRQSSLNSTSRIPVPAPMTDLESLPLSHLPENLLNKFCERLPKVELHQHLEGSFTAEMVLALADKHGFELPSHELDELREYLQVSPDNTSLVQFLEKFHTIGALFNSPEAIKDLTYETIKEAAKHNTRHLELRYSPSYMALTKSLSLHEVSDAVLKGVKAASNDFPISVSLIAIVERQMPLDVAEGVIDHAIAYAEKGICAVDLANDEANFPPGPFAPLFEKARKAGLSVTIHAGEAAGPENILTAVKDCYANRIGHGVRLFEDPEALKEIARLGIPLELCLTSNYQTSALDESTAYPLRLYLEHGIPVSINTDDPGVCGVDQSIEWKKHINAAGLTLQEVRSILHHSMQASFLETTKKATLEAQLSQELDTLKDWLKEELSKGAH